MTHAKPRLILLVVTVVPWSRPGLETGSSLGATPWELPGAGVPRIACIVVCRTRRMELRMYTWETFRHSIVYQISDHVPFLFPLAHGSDIHYLKECTACLGGCAYIWSYM
jgi:hypothetical protein